MEDLLIDDGRRIIIHLGRVGTSYVRRTSQSKLHTYVHVHNILLARFSHVARACVSFKMLLVG